jgi:multidrug efflux pump subunit AcrA (membrane-fusion protein)
MTMKTTDDRVKSRYLRPRFTLLSLAFSSLALFPTTGCKAKPEEAPAVEVTVDATHPTVGDISEEIAGDAILAPLAQAAIAPRISAPIREEYVQRGAHVKKGQLLISLESRDLHGSALDSKGAVALAQANLRATTDATIPEDLKKAEGEVADTKAAYDLAARTAQERKKLFEQGALSGRDADTAYAAQVQAQSAYEQAVKHLDAVKKTTALTSKDAAEGQLTSANGRLESAQAMEEFASLRSPIDGVVTDRPMFPGETAAAGSTVITVMDTSSLLAKLHLAQSSAQKLKLGHKAEITVPGVDAPVEATVSLISPALDPGSTTVEVWLKLPNKLGLLKVGTPVHAVILGATIKEAMQVPTAAIVPSNDGGTSVMVIKADGTAHKKAVTVGIRTPEMVQILSGLEADDMVITTGGYGLDNGTKVKVGKPDSDDDEDNG